jgi:hypothetical protein
MFDGHSNERQNCKKISLSTKKKCVADPQEDFLFTIDTTLCKILKKCVFEQFLKFLKSWN